MVEPSFEPRRPGFRGHVLKHWTPCLVRRVSSATEWGTERRRGREDVGIGASEEGFGWELQGRGGLRGGGGAAKVKGKIGVGQTYIKTHGKVQKAMKQHVPITQNPCSSC